MPPLCQSSREKHLSNLVSVNHNFSHLKREQRTLTGWLWFKCHSPVSPPKCIFKGTNCWRAGVQRSYHRCWTELIKSRVAVEDCGRTSRCDCIMGRGQTAHTVWFAQYNKTTFHLANIDLITRSLVFMCSDMGINIWSFHLMAGGLQLCVVLLSKTSYRQTKYGQR